MKLETKKAIWSLSFIKYQCLIPRIEGEWWAGWAIIWLWWSLDRLDKEWLKDCERHGCSFYDVFEMIERENE